MNKNSEKSKADTQADPLDDAIAALLVQVDAQHAQVNALRKRLKELKQDKLDAPAEIEKQTQKLLGLSLDLVGKEAAVKELADLLSERAAQLRASSRDAFLKAMAAAAAEAEVGLSMLSDQPLTLGLQPFALAVDLDRATVALQYAREEVAEAKLDPTEILQTRLEAGRKIRETSLDNEVFFERLYTAYRITLLQVGQDPESRVDLVDLIPALTLLQAEPAAHRKGRAKVKPYPRYMLAYQLARLRRQGAMQQGKVRLELGVATGGSTKNKSNVLFIPHSGEEGQYYLSIRFMRRGLES